jgi:hypothetical protein
MYVCMYVYMYVYMYVFMYVNMYSRGSFIMSEKLHCQGSSSSVDIHYGLSIVEKLGANHELQPWRRKNLQHDKDLRYCVVKK